MPGLHYLSGQSVYCFGTKSLYSTIGVWSGVGSWKLFDCKQRCTPRQEEESERRERRRGVVSYLSRLSRAHATTVKSTLKREETWLTCALSRAILSCNSLTLSVWSMELARSPSVSISWFWKGRWVRSWAFLGGMCARAQPCRKGNTQLFLRQGKFLPIPVSCSKFPQNAKTSKVMLC